MVLEGGAQPGGRNAAAAVSFDWTGVENSLQADGSLQEGCELKSDEGLENLLGFATCRRLAHGEGQAGQIAALAEEVTVAKSGFEGALDAGRAIFRPAVAGEHLPGGAEILIDDEGITPVARQREFSAVVEIPEIEAISSGANARDAGRDPVSKNEKKSPCAS